MNIIAAIDQQGTCGSAIARRPRHIDVARPITGSVIAAVLDVKIVQTVGVTTLVNIYRLHKAIDNRAFGTVEPASNLDLIESNKISSIPGRRISINRYSITSGRI